ncbi:MAG: exodeoxyribonuclease V subunit alpha [Desulfofustis sp. PB-SRB1]|jgi:exodeoxyribonuclease V alpha subunit|nr:exodeoxyribonuclease V subunit alpha [Desulfofustis sp. PB-SRB1]MBM1001770.1 exodeoxyribonuclease V subunit alpha [Desulfofustis sp. PB-SRB1]HBH28470.1 exodeoxyribonuclease V subunit alpha [Desulfofustis sp.]HBH31505.1 exodeoxyribonuclease V subunit alpha [Desulfofustis sp.]
MAEASTQSIDLAVADFFSGRCGLEGDDRRLFYTIMVSLSAALRDGHTCLRCTKEQQEILLRTTVVSSDGSGPLVLSYGRLYFSRYFDYETSLTNRLADLCRETVAVSPPDELFAQLFPTATTGDDMQLCAARMCATRRLGIITGGPGTGKTTVVVRICALLQSFHNGGLRIALAAPTGKGATRLQELVRHQIQSLPISDRIKPAMVDTAHTIHRLLGASRHATRFRHHAGNPLPYDLVVVDEASMIDLALMAKLVDALGARTQLILLGDKDQLASVESGAVLAECASALPDNLVELRNSYRFNEEIRRLAQAINNGAEDDVCAILGDNQSKSCLLAEERWFEQVVERYAACMSAAHAIGKPSEYPALFQRFSEFRVLCALRRGPYGVAGLNQRVERALSSRGHDIDPGGWYVGRPVLITRNDYQLNLFNGDIGLCLPDPEHDGELSVWFETSAGGYVGYPPSRLPAHETAWAMTVHKSQGTEFSRVVVVLPAEDSRVLCRELLYTAVTRARTQVIIVGPEPIIRTTVCRRTVRTSGVGERLRALQNKQGVHRL